MTDENHTSKSALIGLKRQFWLTRVGMVAERAVRQFWPFATILMAVLAALIFRISDLVSLPVLAGMGVVAALGLVMGFVLGARGFVWPSDQDAEARLDATLPGRPISTLQDDPAIGQNDPSAMAVWRAHLARMADRVRSARAPAPDLRVAARDPFALRLIAGTALVLALTFGALDRVGDVGPCCRSI